MTRHVRTCSRVFGGVGVCTLMDELELALRAPTPLGRDRPLSQLTNQLYPDGRQPAITPLRVPLVIASTHFILPLPIPIPISTPARPSTAERHARAHQNPSRLPLALPLRVTSPGDQPSGDHHPHWSSTQTLAYRLSEVDILLPLYANTSRTHTTRNGDHACHLPFASATRTAVPYGRVAPEANIRSTDA